MMPTKAQLEEQVAELTAQLREMTRRAELAESTDSQIGKVVGYYILDPNQDSIWDGVLHPSIESAKESLNDPATRVVESAEGWAVYECRRVGGTDMDLWDRIEKAIDAAAVSRFDAEWRWPTCHKRECRGDHGDIDFVYRTMAETFKDSIRVELLCKAISEPDCDDAPITDAQHLAVLLGMPADSPVESVRELARRVVSKGKIESYFGAVLDDRGSTDLYLTVEEARGNDPSVPIVRTGTFTVPEPKLVESR